jgi:ferric-dicitrate binding protein FerR (iron transport regulator)
MHPTEETLRDYADGRLRAGEAEALAAHLTACAACAASVKEILAWGDRFAALSESERTGAEPALPAGLREALYALAPSARGSRRPWVLAAAAAALLALGLGVALRGRAPQGPAQAASSSSRLASSRLLSPAEGLDLALGPDARLSGEGRDWRLASGSCLVRTGGLPVRIQSGSLSVRASAGEFILSTGPRGSDLATLLIAEAFAGDEGFRLAVLEGTVEVESGGRRQVLAAGDCLEAPWILSRPGEERLARWREDILPAPAPAGALRLLGSARREGGACILDGSGAMAACLAPVPAEPYLAELRFRGGAGLEVLGLSYTVGGQPTLLLLPAASLRDGGRHRVRLLVTANWILATLDGKVLQKVPHAGFRANPEAGLDGVGLVAWGGETRCEGLAVETLP